MAEAPDLERSLWEVLDDDDEINPYGKKKEV